ncbi:MAG: hypothetical protein BMS9Abin15_0529 [Gammaproteobacteria bacterium]|nr:MAG: hypothetical protein BMS9Abin15_0529 [Gammaproteobacteria bacterium]
MADITNVAAQDPGKENSPISETLEDESTVVMDKAVKCYWNGEGFDDGGTVCTDGVVYECHYGRWLKTKQSC